MNADSFFQRFRLVSRAPNGVGRLRELVLRLVVTGRLSSDRGTDGLDGQHLLESAGVKPIVLVQCKLRKRLSRIA